MILTDELRREGLARDLVRAVQEVRKNAGLALSELLHEWAGHIQGETLAESLTLDTPPDHTYAETVALDGVRVTVGVADC